MRKEPRLRFTDEERADPALEKPIRKVDRAAVKADKAQAKIPKKQVRQKAVDLGTGKVTTKLVLEDKKKPPSKLLHTRITFGTLNPHERAASRLSKCVSAGNSSPNR